MATYMQPCHRANASYRVGRCLLVSVDAFVQPSVDRCGAECKLVNAMLFGKQVLGRNVTSAADVVARHKLSHMELMLVSPYKSSHS